MLPKTLRWLCVWSLVSPVWLLAESAAPAVKTPPRLAVVISIDKFRYDYLDRFAAVFAPGGFRRLREQVEI